MIPAFSSRQRRFWRERRAAAKSFLRRGLTLYNRSRIPEALFCFEKASSLDPHDPQASYLSGLALKALGKELEAKDQWQKMLRLKPDHKRDKRGFWAYHMAQKLLTS